MPSQSASRTFSGEAAVTARASCAACGRVGCFCCFHCCRREVTSSRGKVVVVRLGCLPWPPLCIIPLPTRGAHASPADAGSGVRFAASARGFGWGRRERWPRRGLVTGRKPRRVVRPWAFVTGAEDFWIRGGGVGVSEESLEAPRHIFFFNPEVVNFLWGFNVFGLRAGLAALRVGLYLPCFPGLLWEIVLKIWKENVSDWKAPAKRRFWLDGGI